MRTESDSSSGDAKDSATTHIVTMPSSDEGDDVLPATGLHRRSKYVSVHRKALDYINADSQEARRHPVPHRDPSVERTEQNLLPGESHHSSSAFMRRISMQVEQNFHRQDKPDCNKVMENLVPAWSWLKTYDFRNTLTADLVAGLTVGIMVVPQSMSYAKLAGLPVEFGLYSAFAPVFAYSIFGTSRQLAVGPVALISLLVNAGITSILEGKNVHPDNTENYQDIYNKLALQTSFLVGIGYILMGLLKLGFITIFMSHAVISGFTTGAAVIIGMSQIKYIFGYDIAGSKQLHELLREIFSNIDQFNYKTFLVGTLSIFVLSFLKHIGKTKPKFRWVRPIGPLVVTIIGIILEVALQLDKKGIPIVKFIPSGLPSVTASLWFPIDDFAGLMLVVVSCCVVGFMESIAIAKQLASKHKYEIDSSQELVGLGVANFVAGLFNAYPITGSFSRSAVNHESGAKTGVAGMVTATLVGFVLLVLTPVFEKLPLAVLAAIVISGVLGLLDYPEAIYLWRVHRFDFAVWCTACLGTMFLGVEIGLAIAVGVSLLIVIYESAYPHTSVMGRLPGTNIYRNVKQYRDAETYDGVVIVRIDAPIYFANAQNVRDKVRKYRLAAQDDLDERQTNAEVKYIVLEFSPVSHVDTSALHVLEDMYETYLERGQQICFSNPSMRVMDRLERAGFIEKVGEEHFFVSLSDAVSWCLQQMDAEAVSSHGSVHDRGIVVADDLSEDALTASNV